MATPSPARPPVVFVHGLWLHADSWKPWVDFFQENGYNASAASWPGDGASTQATRQEPGALAGFGIGQIADHIASQLKHFNRLPILIGHSFGGLLAQNLLGRDLAAAAIAIDPAPIRGVPELPLSAIRATLPVLSNPLNFSHAVSLTESQFRYGFANALEAAEAKQLYDRYTMPAPARPLFQAALATINPRAETRVNVENAARGPLLLIAGADDHTVPPVMVRSTLRNYRNSAAVTDFKEFTSRGHSLTIDHGWRDIAEFCLAWLKSKGL